MILNFIRTIPDLLLAAIFVAILESGHFQVFWLLLFLDWARGEIVV